MRRLGSFVFGSLLLLGCRGGASEKGSPDAAVASRPAALERLAEARKLAKGDWVFDTVLAPRSAHDAAWTLRTSNETFVTQGFTDALGGVPMAFGGRLSTFADGALEVRSGDAQVGLKLLGARSVEGSLVEGEVVYTETHPSTDFVVGTAPDRVESFFLLRDSAAPRSFSMSLALTGFTARLANGAVEFVDAKGVARLHMPQPTALDARGTRRSGALTLEGSTLTVSLEVTDLAYPILLDPALEQIAWTNLGPNVPTWPPPGTTAPPRMTLPSGLQRAGGTARAGNGKVYLFGGSTVGGTDSSMVTPLVTQLMEWGGTAWAPATGGNFGDSLVLASPNNGTVDRVADFAWDATRKKLVMFGGFSFGAGDPHMGVYEYDPNGTKVWTSVCGSLACWTSAPVVNIASPTPPTAVFAFNKMMMVHDTGTYEWDPVSVVFKKSTALPELKRAGAGLAFDVARNRLVAYGDRTGLSDTWEFDGTNWAKILSTGPLGVRNPSLAYHAGRKRAVLWASSWTTSGVWTWSGTAWSAITLSGSGPTPTRPNAAFTYDDASGKMLMVGGGDLGAGNPSNCFMNGYTTPFDVNQDLRTCARVDTWSSVIFGGACAATTDCGVGQTCVDGVCCQTACSGSCQRCDLAGSVGKCTAVLDAEDVGTCSGTSTCDATGTCRKKLGQKCTLGTECSGGNCVDGYCCNTSCPGACEACNQTGSTGTCSPLPKGSSGTGCGLNTCGGTSGACSTTCAADTDCATNAYCKAGACVAALGKGSVCTRNRECGTGVCADGVCCDSACAGTCDACSKALGATSDGTCTVLPKTVSPAECGAARCSGVTAACGSTCTVDTDCSTTGFCNGGVCSTLRKKGESCERNPQCGSGLACTDGVCCNEACNGACQACSALNKASGDKSGECGPAKEGTNPRALCTKSAVTTCGSSGFCNATGACAVYSAGTACGPTGTTSCDGESVKGQTCDGLGACILDTTGTPCAPGRCLDGACKTSCAADTDCAADAYCTAGSCKKKSDSGAKCALDAQCKSGFCADGVCCNARCDGSCEACDQAGTEGTCTAVTGKPRLGHPACAAGEPGNPCSAAACDGVSRTSCAKKAGADVPCRPGSCDGNVESLPASCDGSGACPAGETRPCQPYACGADACKKTCADGKDCKPGFVCNTETGACTLGDKCAGSIVTKVDGTTEDCAPYVCESSGRCKKTCAITADCVAGKICNGTTCIDAIDASVDEGGGCAASPRGIRSGGLFVLFGALAGAMRRRRRQA